ncbi:TPR-REGION domain-containing protein [Mycena kentingensis (nom. inval.)]|nr:TPR-REGION domain-containing protein [Mycena kentingensis (nom. inval.)]
MSKENPAVEILKLEGDALYKQGDYEAAHAKYTEATALKPTGNALAVLYSNRAACALQLKGYLYAVYDGQQATKADPSFFKGYIRTATAADALDLSKISKAAWSAARALVKEGDPAAKAQCESGIDAAAAAPSKREAELQDGFVDVAASQLMPHDVPWVRAAVLRATNRLPEYSSGHVVLEAAHNSELVRQRLNNLEVIQVDGQRMHKMTGSVLGPLMDAIFLDDRTGPTSPELMPVLERMIVSEIEATRGWPSSSPDEIKKELPSRLRDSGWDGLIPAITSTIRNWIWRAFLDSKRGKPLDADKGYQRAIEMLEWGAREFAEGLQENRGAIFNPTFVRGARSHRLSNIIAVYRTDASLYSLEDILKLAREMEYEIENAAEMPASYTPGFVTGFSAYPQAEAFSIIAWYHMQRGIEMTRGEPDVAENDIMDKAHPHFIESAEYYLKSAETYPPDSEHHLHMLIMALEAQWRGQAPISMTLPLVRRARDALPKAAAIWKAAMPIELKAKLEEASIFVELCEEKMMEGTWNPTNAYGPEVYTVASTRQMEKVGCCEPAGWSTKENGGLN